MKEVLYEITVYKDGTLRVDGWLPTEQIIEIARFYKEQGYIDTLIGEENSSLHLSMPRMILS